MATIKENNGWTCTDPDNHQYGRKISNGVYEFKEWIGGGVIGESIKETIEREFDNDSHWEQSIIKVSDYTPGQIRDYVSGYYNSLEDLKTICGKDWEWIVAECIFERQSGLY